MQLQRWAKSPITSSLSLSVNVSPKQFKQGDFATLVTRALQDTGAPANQLVLELTESALLDDPDAAIARMEELRKAGVRFSLDDFGTGYSSLKRLQRLPISEIKIDRSFVNDIASNSKDADIVRAITALGHSLGLHVLAEGVENHQQREVLQQNGCYAWQGFLAGKPMPIEEFDAMLEDQEGRYKLV